MNAPIRPPVPVTDETVACDVCMKEIPVSESTSEEAVDYVVHFCGLQCHDQWKAQQEHKDGG